MGFTEKFEFYEGFTKNQYIRGDCLKRGGGGPGKKGGGGVFGGGGGPGKKEGSGVFERGLIRLATL